MMMVMTIRARLGVRALDHRVINRCPRRLALLNLISNYKADILMAVARPNATRICHHENVKGVRGGEGVNMYGFHRGAEGRDVGGGRCIIGTLIVYKLRAAEPSPISGAVVGIVWVRLFQGTSLNGPRNWVDDSGD